MRDLAKKEILIIRQEIGKQIMTRQEAEQYLVSQGYDSYTVSKLSDENLSVEIARQGQDPSLTTTQQSSSNPLQTAQTLASGYAAQQAGRYVLGQAKGSILGSGAASTGGSAAASGAANTGVNLASEASVLNGMTGSSAAGSAATPTAAAGTGLSGYAGMAAPIVLPAIAAYTASQAADAYEQGRGKNTSSAIKESMTDGSALNYVPLLGQARWAGAGLGSLIGHVSPTTRQRRRAQDAASNLDEQTGSTSGTDWYNASIEGNPEVKQNWQTASAAQADDFVGLDSNGMWVNNKFANSRDVADLKPEDIWQSAQMQETYGKDWNNGKYTNYRRQIAQGLLDKKAVDEKKGGIYFNIGNDEAIKLADDIVSRGSEDQATKKDEDTSSREGYMDNSVNGVAQASADADKAVRGEMAGVILKSQLSKLRGQYA